MGKTNYHAASKVKNTPYETLSKLIIDAIEQEQFFNKETLIPKVRAILKGFSVNINASKYNRIETPSDAARRLRSLEQKDIEVKYWHDLVKTRCPNEIQRFYDLLDIKLEDAGFPTKRKK